MIAHLAIAVLNIAPSITDKVLQKTTISESFILFLLGAAMVGAAGVLHLRSLKSPQQGATERVRASTEEAAAQPSPAQASRAEVA